MSQLKDSMEYQQENGVETNDYLVNLMDKTVNGQESFIKDLECRKDELMEEIKQRLWNSSELKDKIIETKYFYEIECVNKIVEGGYVDRVVNTYYSEKSPADAEKQCGGNFKNMSDLRAYLKQLPRKYSCDCIQLNTEEILAQNMLRRDEVDALERSEELGGGCYFEV